MNARDSASNTVVPDRAGPAVPAHARPGGHTHALICRLAPGADSARIERQVHALVAGLAGRGASTATEAVDASGADVRPCFFVDSVPFPSASDSARRRRASEAARPLSAGAGQAVRATILQYGDGERDLVLVGDRARLDQQGLTLAAAACLSSAPASIPAMPPAPKPHAPSDVDALIASSFSPNPEWECHGTSSERGVSAVALPTNARIAPECWLAALGLVLARCHAMPAPAVASLQEGDDDGTAASSTAGYGLVDLALDQAASVADTVERVRSRARQAPRLTGELLDDLKARRGQPVEIGVGMLFPAAASLDDASVAQCEYLACHAPVFPLTLVVDARERRVTCHFDGAIHAASSVGWLLRSLVHTAVQFAQGAGTVAQIESLPADAQRRVADLGRGPVPASTAPLRIEQAFRRIAAEHPEAVALSFQDETLTYAQLDELSSRLATVLAGRGVVQGNHVGICLRRSVPVVVAMLAILKCGAVYVPMDPDYPDDRLRYTAEDAGLKLVLTETGTFPAGQGTEAVAIGNLIDHARTTPVDPRADSGPDADGAYVIYTSGSTGRPKGVLIPHRNVMSLIAATRERFAFSPADTWTLFHSSAFDFSVWEIWGCLLSGGHLVVVSHEVSRDPDRFRDLINRESVSVLNQTPSAFYQLIEADRRERIGDSLRLVIFGGEGLDARSLLGWFDRHPESRCRLVNMFGITETTVHVTWQEIGRREALAGSRSVGPPIPGWHVYIMDDDRRLLPPGSVGEIYVGGAGVASCYHNRPDLTALRFVHDPHTGAVMYRSGDRGRLRPDGALEHLGRLDSQVKLRGFRIELDEIRRVILGHPSVSAAAVLLNQPDRNDSASARIDAYVVAEGVDAAELRRHASGFLPEHMVPSTFVPVAAIPMTVNGKLDVERLRSVQVSEPRAPDPGAGKDDTATSDVARLMLSIWQGALGREIDMDDNFFDLGGNSLIAIRIASAMRKEGLPPLPMSELYTHQTVRNLVAVIEPRG